MEFRLANLGPALFDNYRKSIQTALHELAPE